ncbi:MAG: hypothetical protein RIS75_895, partial [Actinomycetota bacterium]
MVTPIFELSDNFVSELVKRDPIAATELGQTSELLPDF